jgi:hypothetical protein
MPQTKKILLSEEALIGLGFTISKFRPSSIIHSPSIDRFHGLDYATLEINKDSVFSDTLCIRFNKDKFILDEYYSVRFYTTCDIEKLIDMLSLLSKKINNKKQLS